MSEVKNTFHPNVIDDRMFNFDPVFSVFVSNSSILGSCLDVGPLFEDGDEVGFFLRVGATDEYIPFVYDGATENYEAPTTGTAMTGWMFFPFYTNDQRAAVIWNV